MSDIDVRQLMLNRGIQVLLSDLKDRQFLGVLVGPDDYCVLCAGDTEEQLIERLTDTVGEGE